MFDYRSHGFCRKSAREDLKAQVTETRDVGTGAFTNKTNLQPDSSSNIRAFEAELSTLYSMWISEGAAPDLKDSTLDSTLIVGGILIRVFEFW